MTTYRTTPTYEVPISDGKNTTAAWYRWFNNLHLGIPPSSEIAISVGASPFIYAPKIKGGVIVSGGTVSNVLISRSGIFYSTGATGGLFNLSANDQLKVVFSGAPAMVFLPS
jgi:hypothetical protein